MCGLSLCVVRFFCLFCCSSVFVLFLFVLCVVWFVCIYECLCSYVIWCVCVLFVFLFVLYFLLLFMFCVCCCGVSLFNLCLRKPGGLEVFFHRPLTPMRAFYMHFVCIIVIKQRIILNFKCVTAHYPKQLHACYLRFSCIVAPT